MNRLAHETLMLVIGAFCAAAAGLAAGTTAGTIKIANAIDYSIAGIFYSKAITDNIALTAAAVQAISTKCLYLISIDSAGNVVTTKGAEVGLTDSAYLPLLPDGHAPVGFINVQTDGVTTFTAGTTSLAAAGLTVTYTDLSRVPNTAF